jgi:hypothetical protein
MMFAILIMISISPDIKNIRWFSVLLDILSIDIDMKAKAHPCAHLIFMSGAQGQAQGRAFACSHSASGSTL